MNAQDFTVPEKHPFDMLKGYQHAFEKESTLQFILSKCIGQGNINAVVSTIYFHADMVDDGLLNEYGDRQYQLTKKAIGLLYGYYGKDEISAP